MTRMYALSIHTCHFHCKTAEFLGDHEFFLYWFSKITLLKMTLLLRVGG